MTDDFVKFGSVVKFKPPRCPLCHGRMETQYLLSQGFHVFVCHKDKIGINVHDPFVGRWDEAEHRATDGKGIPCPRPTCGARMRYFATSTGYMKAKCPRCGAVVEAKPGDFKAPGAASPEAPGPVQ